MMKLDTLEKYEQTTPQDSRQGNTTKSNTEINELETKQTIQTINEPNCWIFEKMERKRSKLIKLELIKKQ